MNKIFETTTLVIRVDVDILTNMTRLKLFNIIHGLQQNQHPFLGMFH